MSCSLHAALTAFVVLMLCRGHGDRGHVRSGCRYRARPGASQSRRDAGRATGRDRRGAARRPDADAHGRLRRGRDEAPTPCNRSHADRKHREGVLGRERTRARSKGPPLPRRHDRGASPESPVGLGSVTVRQLLNHTSGVPDFIKKKAFEETVGSSLTVAPAPEKLLDFIADDPLAFPPGAKYEYSNSENIIVGLIVQAVTKKPYADALRELVYMPLELAQTSLPTGPELPTPFIHGYGREGKSAPEDISESFASGWAWASGGIVSTPLDLNRFIRGYVGGKALRHRGAEATTRVHPGRRVRTTRARSQRCRAGGLPIQDALRHDVRSQWQHDQLHAVRGSELGREPLDDDLDQPATHARERKGRQERYSRRSEQRPTSPSALH